MKYLLKDWGVGGTTSPLEQKRQELVLTPPPAAPKVPDPGDEVMDVATLARKRTDLALVTLVNAMIDDSCPWGTKVTAAVAMLDRGHGRVAPPLMPVPQGVTININGPQNMTLQDKLKYGAEVLAVLKETEDQAIEVEFTQDEEEQDHEAVG